MKPVDAFVLNHVDADMDWVEDRVVSLDEQVEIMDLRVEPQVNW